MVQALQVEEEKKGSIPANWIPFQPILRDPNFGN